MSTETKWDANSLESKIVKLLKGIRHDAHPFSRPFVTGYQLAILFKEEFPEAFERMGYPVGGEGSGGQETLTKYLNRELARRVRRQEIPNIEGGFLSEQRLRRIEFTDARKPVFSTSTGDQNGMAVFRYVERESS